jgi:hypothetical protein
VLFEFSTTREAVIQTGLPQHPGRFVVHFPPVLKRYPTVLRNYVSDLRITLGHVKEHLPFNQGVQTAPVHQSEGLALPCPFYVMNGETGLMSSIWFILHP